MADSRNARLVSGEIMTTAPAGDAPTRREPPFDIVDAEFETLDRGAETVTVAPSVFAGLKPLPHPGMDILRKRQAMVRPFGSARGGPLFWTAGLGLAVMAFWFSGGHALIPQDMFPPAQPSALPLRIASVVSRVDTSGDRAMLNIDGEAVNDGMDMLLMPPLDIEVVATDGGTTRYNLGTSGSPVAPGEKFAFASRLPVPRNGVKSVSVTVGR
jgi:hypothetical protein